MPQRAASNIDAAFSFFSISDYINLRTGRYELVNRRSRRGDKFFCMSGVSALKLQGAHIRLASKIYVDSEG